MPKSTEKRKTNVRRTLYYFLYATKKYKLLACGAILLTTAVFVLRSAIIPLNLANMIGDVSNGLAEEQIIPTLLPQALVVIVAMALNNFVFGPLRLYCVWKMEVYTINDLDTLAFNTISAQSMQFHNNRFSGSLVSQVNRFVGAYERFMDEFFWNVYPVILDILMILIIMTPRAPLFSLGIIILSIIYIIFAIIWFKKIAPINEREASVANKKTGQLADSITNITSVKSYAGETYEQRRYGIFQRDYINTTFAALRANTKRNYFFDSINVAISVLVVALLMGGQTWLGLSVATLILVVNYSQNIMGDLWSIHSVFKSFNRIFGDSYEMTEILDMEDDVVDAPNATTLKLQSGAVDFTHVTFRHADAKAPIFQDFSLSIQPGERVGLVGVSGSGKTTVTKLLLRFADVQDGGIFIDGQNISQVTQHSLRKNIAYVPQETSLFHRSIADNIAYARPNATQAEIIRAAKLANAHEFIKDLPNGYDTLVGERGVKLSGGQRQRIAIARAILKDAPILVLDEATSALDSESEALIQSALEELMKGRTSIVIAHRLSTVASLDRIVVLNDGKIVEQGTHRQLLKGNGPYAKLWSRQSGAFLEESE